MKNQDQNANDEKRDEWEGYYQELRKARESGNWDLYYELKAMRRRRERGDSDTIYYPASFVEEASAVDWPCGIWG